MPVRRLAARECPEPICPAQSGGDVMVGGHILFVVVKNERMTGDGPVEHGGSQHQHEANDQGDPLLFHISKTPNRTAIEFWFTMHDSMLTKLSKINMRCREVREAVIRNSCRRKMNWAKKYCQDDAGLNCKNHKG